mgnify:CR=1 FL=1
MPESKYSIGGIKNGISILFFTMKEGVTDAEYRITNRFGNFFILYQILQKNIKMEKILFLLLTKSKEYDIVLLQD